jgi:hypothetical protein
LAEAVDEAPASLGGTTSFELEAVLLGGLRGGSPGWTLAVEERAENMGRGIGYHRETERGDVGAEVRRVKRQHTTRRRG